MWAPSRSRVTRARLATRAVIKQGCVPARSQIGSSSGAVAEAPLRRRTLGASAQPTLVPVGAAHHTRPQQLASLFRRHVFPMTGTSVLCTRADQRLRDQETAMWESRLSMALSQRRAEAVLLVLAQAPSIGLTCDEIVLNGLKSRESTGSGISRLRAIVAAVVTACVLPLSPHTASFSSPLHAVMPSHRAKEAEEEHETFAWAGSVDPYSVFDTTQCYRGSFSGATNHTRAQAESDALHPFAVLWISTCVRHVEPFIAQYQHRRDAASAGAAATQRETHSDDDVAYSLAKKLLRECQRAGISLAPNMHVATELAARFLSAYDSPSQSERACDEKDEDMITLTDTLAEVGCALRHACTRLAHGADTSEVMARESDTRVSVEALLLSCLKAAVSLSKGSVDDNVMTAKRTDAHLSPSPPAPPRAPHAPIAPAAPVAPATPLFVSATPETHKEGAHSKRATHARSSRASSVLLRLWVPETRTAATAATSIHEARFDFQAWYLHCLLATGQFAAVNRILKHAGAVASVDWVAEALPTSLHRELLTLMPHDLLMASDVFESLSRLVLAATQQEVRQRLEESAPHAHFNLPRKDAVTDALEVTRTFYAMQRQQRRAAPLAITRHAVLYGRMIVYLVSCCAGAQSAAQYDRHLRDLQGLFHIANMNALASSLVPGELPLPEVMIAQPDQRRTDKIADLAESFRRAVDYLCESPLLFEAEETRTTPTVSTGDTVTSNGVSHALSSSSSSSSCAGLTTRSMPSPPRQDRWRHDQLVWRRTYQGHVDAAIARGTDLFSELLLLCSDRSGCLPARAAEPAWRRELRKQHAVRSHKYQILLPELPHTTLRDTLTALLKAGYVIDSARVGHRLVEAHHIDLNYYPLPLLGALYEAMRLVDKAARTPVVSSSLLSENDGDVQTPMSSLAQPVAMKPEVLAKVRDFYLRRQRVFGDALDTTAMTTAMTDAAAAMDVHKDDNNSTTSATPPARQRRPHSPGNDALLRTSVVFNASSCSSLSPAASASAAGLSGSSKTPSDLVVDPATTRALATMRIARRCGVREGSSDHKSSSQERLLTFVHHLVHRSTLAPGGGLLISPIQTSHTDSGNTREANSAESKGIWLKKGHVTSGT